MCPRTASTWVDTGLGYSPPTLKRFVCKAVVTGRVCFGQVSTSPWCPATTCVSFPARGNHLVITACSLADHVCSVSDSQNETCIFFFCRQRRYFQANQGLRSKKKERNKKKRFLGSLGLEIFQFIMNCMKCLNQAIYKYAREVPLALKNSIFTLPCNALYDGFPNCIYKACTNNTD